MKNASPAISPWAGPAADPVGEESADAPVVAVVDRVHGMVVQVFAARGPEKINTASGVLAGGGLVLTDMRALLFVGPAGSMQVATEIAVLTSKGAFPARLVDSALDAGVAVLELPEAASELEGPPLAQGSGDVGDQLIAVHASKQGPAIVFEVIGFSVERTGNPLQLRAAPALPHQLRRCAGVRRCRSAGRPSGRSNRAGHHFRSPRPSAADPDARSIPGGAGRRTHLRFTAGAGRWRSPAGRRATPWNGPVRRVRECSSPRVRCPGPPSPSPLPGRAPAP